ncbi:MAG: DUF3667 domain-containing protein [Chitinophagaceae bacterium]|nr:MAG: DUF3667 domain-containing protein [Chitinophagaceae bacterium]
MEVAVSHCPSCGAPFAGTFCAACGEKKSSAHEFTAGHFIEESIEGFTHFDNKFLRTLKLLLFRPGALTVHFAGGRKVPYMKPMQLFIVSNLLFFLLVGGANVFAHRLGNYLNVRGGIFNTRAAFFRKFSAADLPRVTELFNEKMTGQSKAFIFLFIPFYALACALLFLRRKKPLGLHLSFAAHFFSFLLLYFTLFHFLFVLPDRYLFHMPSERFEQLAIYLNLLVLVGYFTLAARRFYRSGWIFSVFSGLFAGVFFIILLQAYRLFLFHNILRTLH